MLLLDTILQDIGDPSKCKQIRPVELKYLGYEVTQRKTPVGHSVNGKPLFFIHEILDAETKKEASFCFLYCSNKQLGVVLPNCYDRYLRARHAEEEFKATRKPPGVP